MDAQSIRSAESKQIPVEMNVDTAVAPSTSVELVSDAREIPSSQSRNPQGKTRAPPQQDFHEQMAALSRRASGQEPIHHKKAPSISLKDLPPLDVQSDKPTRRTRRGRSHSATGVRHERFAPKHRRDRSKTNTDPQPIIVPAPRYGVGYVAPPAQPLMPVPLPAGPPDDGRPRAVTEAVAVRPSVPNPLKFDYAFPPEWSEYLERLGAIPGKGGHSHPVLAALRRIAEHRAYGLAKQLMNDKDIQQPSNMIHDWGGCQRRHRIYRRSDVHSSHPLTSAKDFFGTGDCEHTAQECKCYLFDISMSVDVLYYINPEDVYDTLMRQNLPIHIGVIHNLMDLELYPYVHVGERFATPEAKCVFTGRQVTFDVEGGQSLTHNIPWWIYEGKVRTGKGYLYSVLKRNVGCMGIYQIFASTENLKADPTVRLPINPLWDLHDRPTKLLAALGSKIKTHFTPGDEKLYRSRVDKYAEECGYEITGFRYTNWVRREFTQLFRDMADQYTAQMREQVLDKGYWRMALDAGILKTTSTWAEWAIQHWLNRPWYIRRSVQGLGLGLVYLLNRRFRIIQRFIGLIARILTRISKSGQGHMSLSVALRQLCSTSRKKFRGLWYYLYLFIAKYEDEIVTILITCGFAFIVKHLTTLFSLSYSGTFTYVQQPILKYCVGHEFNDAPIDPNSRCVFPTLPDQCEPKPGGQLVGVGLAFSIPIIPSTCVHNLTAAIKCRMVCPKLPCEEDLWDKAFDRFVRDVPLPGVITPIDFEEWLSRYPAGRANMIRTAMERFYTYGMPDRNFHYIKCFVKREFYLEKNPVRPRCISPQTPEHLGTTGPFVFTFQKEFAKLNNGFDNGGLVFYACGTTGEKVGAWEMLHQHRFHLMSDYKEFDASQGRKALSCENRVYRRSCPDRIVMEVLDEQTHTYGGHESGIKYSTDGVRSSGGSNTSIGNTIDNIMPMHYSVTSIGGRNPAYLVLGDDIVVTTDNRVDPVLLHNMLKRFGYYAKCSNVHHDDVEFCSSVFYPVAGTRILGPKIGRVIGKTFWDKSLTTHKHKWLRSVCLGLRKNVQFVPVLRVLVTRLLELVGDGPTMPLPREEHKIHVHGDYEADESTMEFVCGRYGVSRCDIHELERFMSTVRLGTLLDHPILRIISLIDNGSKYHPLNTQGMLSFKITLYDVIGYYFETYFRPNIPTLFVEVVMISPVVEELAKRHVTGGLLGGAIFGLFEGFANALNSGQIYLVFVKCVAHAVLGAMPLSLGLAAHYAWNTFVYFTVLLPNMLQAQQAQQVAHQDKSLTSSIRLLYLCSSYVRFVSALSPLQRRKVSAIFRFIYRTTMPKTKGKPKPQAKHRRTSAPKAGPTVVRRAAPVASLPKRMPNMSKDGLRYIMARLYPKMGVGAKIPDRHSGLTSSITSYTNQTIAFPSSYNCITIQPRNPSLLYTTNNTTTSFNAPNTSAADWTTISPLIESYRLVAFCVEVIPNYSANMKPGIAYCMQIDGGEALPTKATVESAVMAHSENLQAGCYMNFQNGNFGNDNNAFIAVGDATANYERICIALDGVDTTAVYNVIMTGIYEVVPLTLAHGLLSSERSPTIAGLQDKVDNLAANITPYSTRDFAVSNHGTTKKSGGIVDAAAGLASAVGNSLPGVLGKAVGAFGGVIKSLFG